MNTDAVQKPRMPATVTVKLDRVDRERLSSLASIKKRTPHYLMKEAILEYVQREESRHHFIQAAEASFEHYKETGLHLALDEFSSWVDEVQTNAETPLPECHR